MQVDARLQFTKCAETMRHFRCLLDIGQLGSNKLLFSGSGQFGASHLAQLKARVEQVATQQRIEEIWIIDVRTERHLFFNGKPIILKVKDDHLVDRNKTKAEIIDEENKMAGSITKTTQIWERDDTGHEMGDGIVETEKQVVEKNGMHYLRLPILKHFKPTDECVDEFVQFVQQHPHSWLHAHCYVKERTTVIHVLLDMLHNAKQVSFEDILARQASIGGSNLLKIPSKPEFQPVANERAEFLKKFYTYCQQVDPLTTPAAKTWTQWLKST